MTQLLLGEYERLYISHPLPLVALLRLCSGSFESPQPLAHRAYGPEGERKDYFKDSVQNSYNSVPSASSVRDIKYVLIEPFMVVIITH